MSNGINLAELEKFAVEQVLPTLDNQISKEPSVLLEKIAKPTLTSSKIEVRTTVGVNGGFGYGAETKEIPSSGAQMYETFKLDAVDMYGTIEISNKSLALGLGGDLGGKQLLLTETEGIEKAMSWNIGRGLFGNGKGVLCTTSSGSLGNEVTVSDTKDLKPGLIVDFYANSAEVGSVPAQAKRRILSVDRKGKKIVVDGAKFTPVEGFITLQDSYGKEIFGLGAFFDPTITHIYGVPKAGNNWLIPEEYDANSAISDTLISKAVRESETYKNSKIDMILCGSDAYDNYVDYMKSSKTMITETQEFYGGVSGIYVVAGGRKIVVVPETHLDTDIMLGVDTTQLLFPKTPTAFLNKDGGVFERVNNSTKYQAVLGTYGNLLCKNPGGIFKIKNVKG